MNHVVCDDKIKPIFETIYRQVVKAPFAETARLFKKQWDDFVESVSVVGWKPVYVGGGPTSRVWMNETRNEVKDAAFHMMKRIEREMAEKGTTHNTRRPVIYSRNRFPEPFLK